MKQVTIIATSLSEGSKSQVLARGLEKRLLDAGVGCVFFDLRETPLPICGGAESWQDANVAKIAEAVGGSSHVVFAVPVYNYYVNAAAKNVVELVGQALTHKVISFICSAGGAHSYMSVMSFANHLMLDFRCVIVPRFLYVQGSDWSEDGQSNEAIDGRMDQLVSDMRMVRVEES